MTTGGINDKEKQILSKAWVELTPEDLRYLYFDLNYTRAGISTAFDVTIKQVEYKLRKYGLNKLKNGQRTLYEKPSRKSGTKRLRK